MRVLVAFDKFKDALTASEACDIAARTLRQQHPDWTLDLCPLSDGGDGFEEVMGRAAGGRRVALQVAGPRGTPIEAGIALVTGERIPTAVRSRLKFADRPGREATLAVVEMAAASGLALLTPTLRDPWQTTSYGTGQLIRAAAELGAGAILLGVGGSSTHDLGLGALSALGLEFLAPDGGRIRPPVPARWDEIVRIEGEPYASIPPLHIACDVVNPLLGPQGAATVYGPQKGLRPEQLPALEEASERMAQMLCAHCRQKPDLPGVPGAGAAGGMAFGLMCATGAVLLPGAELVSAWLDLPSRLAAANLIITGEGRFDRSSLSGKGPGALVARGLELSKPVHVFAGQISATAQEHLTLHEITPTDVPLEHGLRHANEFLANTIRRTL